MASLNMRFTVTPGPALTILRAAVEWRHNPNRENREALVAAIDAVADCEGIAEVLKIEQA